ncbi:hypothetical protein ONR57_21975 [Hoyosella sp. YIM 151337]|uniref:hypothetical protein n=1 Tax=Hoyosella sp. YIM 151337 TaxID=2992742 RepID=UPI002235E1AC|nr:hypothetical protein [Hoyosella sp. YIM 151337]MCW4355979.1 hypothetical protein [Hoyosella sp. YIM 151337]
MSSNTEATVPDAETTAQAVPPSPRRRRSTVILAVALAVTTSAALVLGYLYWDATRAGGVASDFAGTDPTGAAAAAAEHAITVSTYSYDNFDAHFDAVAAISTPEFRDEYETAAAELRDFLNEAEGSSTGTADYAAVYQHSDGEATVMVFLDQEVRNVLAPDGRVDRSRLLVTVHREDGRWLLHDITGA